MTKLVYTRYLYALDEVLYTLQESLIKKESFEECVFWAGEIFYSNHQKDLWYLIFEFYYNFCAINNFNLEKKLYKLFDLKSLEKTINALHILYNSTKSFQVFYHFNKDLVLNISFIGRTPKWIKENITEDIKYRKLLISLQKKNYTYIAYIIKNLKENEIQDYYDIIKKYFEFETKKNVNESFLMDNILNINKRLIILAFIFYMFMKKKSKICFTIKYDHDNYKEELFKVNEPVVKKYKTLPEKLKYSISSNIGCFPLKRFDFTYKELKEAYWYSWDYYAYNCNLWRDRFNKYNIKINNDKKCIEFLDDEIYERFCDLYYYETDEQSLETQNKAVPNISKLSIDDWVSKFLDTKQIV